MRSRDVAPDRILLIVPAAAVLTESHLASVYGIAARVMASPVHEGVPFVVFG